MAEKKVCFNAKLSACKTPLYFDIKSARLREYYGLAALSLVVKVNNGGHMILEIDISSPFSEDPRIDYALSAPYQERQDQFHIGFGTCRRLSYKEIYE